jgi:hypothetical protein
MARFDQPIKPMTLGDTGGLGEVQHVIPPSPDGRTLDRPTTSTMERTCRRPPYGRSWRESALIEVSRALSSAMSRRNKNPESHGIEIGAQAKMNKVESSL